MPSSDAAYQSIIDLEAALTGEVREAAVTESLEISLRSADGCVHSRKICFPTRWLADKRPTLTLYCAAQMNNLAMTIGGLELAVVGSRPQLGAQIIAEMQRRYRQVTNVLSRYYAHEIQFLNVDKPPHAETERPAQRDTRHPLPGVTMGINLGQTLTKLILVEDGETLGQWAKVFPTWPAKDGRDFQTLMNALNLQIAQTRKAFGRPIRAFAIAIGGIVRNGRLVTRSGVAAQVPPSDYEQIAAIAEHMAAIHAVPTLLCQDAAAKAHALADASPARTLLLDIGTSTGGAFLSSGIAPDYVNQVGRVVLDISANALARDDGEAVGVMSKYVSLWGLLHARAEYGLEAFSLEAIGDLARENHPAARALLRYFSGLLRDGVRLLNQYYAADNVVLTGGIMQSALGALVVDMLKSDSEPIASTLPTITTSFNPLLDGAIGAAKLASCLR